MPSITFAIGDIHGCLAKLRRLLKACRAYADDRPARFIALGDYVDRGPQSRGVVAFLMDWQRSLPGALVCLRGNHEQMLLDAQNSKQKMALWLLNGAEETLASYAPSDFRIPEDHIAWMDALPLSHDDGLRFFVHACIDVTKPLDRQSADVMLWARDPYLEKCDTTPCGRFIVHGHTPLGAGMPEQSSYRLNLDTGAVYGGPLTAAIFGDTRAEPLGFITDSDGSHHWLDRPLRAMGLRSGR